MSRHLDHSGDRSTLGGVDNGDFRRIYNELFVESVRQAALRTYEETAYRPEREVYRTLAAELVRRGIDPDSEAVQQAAILISRGRKPAVLRRGQRRKPHVDPSVSHRI